MGSGLGKYMIILEIGWPDPVLGDLRPEKLKKTENVI
jgi:hypothetical protein